MKKYISLYIFLLMFLLAGCEKFLNLPPKNERAVETLEDIKSALAGYLDGIKTKNATPIVGQFPIISEEQMMMFEAYSDNIDFQNSMVHYINPLNFHADEKFYADMLLWNQFQTPTNIWTKYYEVIGFLNSLIDQLNETNTGEAGERNRVMGEMLTHRAFYFFKLLQYFAPYNKAELGIPVYLHSGKSVMGVKMARQSQTAVYKIITEDLKKALDLIQTAEPRSSFNIFYNKRSINNLLAQVYWFKAESAAKETGDYASAKTYSQNAVNGVDGLIPATVADFNNTAAGKNINYPAFYQTSNLFGALSPIYGSAWDYSGYEPNSIPVSSSLLSLFSVSDIRKTVYFNNTSTLSSFWPDGTSPSSKALHFFLFQPEEAYLILAECQYRSGETNECIATLNRFKGFRNAGTANGLSGDQLLQEIINERRKEFFCNSDKRWLDLKRYGNVTITRMLRFFNKDYSTTAGPNDYHYALPVPLTEIQQNPDIIPNEGWVPIAY